jgi:hypothetical protein
MPNCGYPAAAVSCQGMAPKGNSQTDWTETTIVLEQFRGRAVRASRDSKESQGALFLESFDSCPAVGSLSPVEPCSHRVSWQQRLGRVLILQFRIRPNLGEATCQEKGFYTLGAAAELVPISSLRRRERFFAKDR